MSQIDQLQRDVFGPWLCAVFVWLFLLGLTLMPNTPPRALDRAVRVLKLGFVIIAIGGAAMLGLFGASGCDARASAPSPMKPPDPRDAVVVLSCSHSVFDDKTNDLFVERYPCCNATAVRDGPGLAAVKLVTAAHCLFHRRPGQDVPYNTRWDLTTFVNPTLRFARIVRVDAGYDRAILSPIAYQDTEELAHVALGLGPSLAAKGAVHTIAGVFGWSYLDGHVIARVYGPDMGAYYVTDLDVRPGWSGSPALDTRGRVVGVVVSYETNKSTGQGIAHSGNFSDLEGFW